MESGQIRRFPFFQAGINPVQKHKEYRTKVVKLLLDEKRPINTTQVSNRLQISWATADKILKELAGEGKIKAFTIGTANCFEINLQAITEILSHPENMLDSRGTESKQ